MVRANSKGIAVKPSAPIDDILCHFLNNCVNALTRVIGESKAHSRLDDDISSIFNLTFNKRSQSRPKQLRTQYSSNSIIVRRASEIVENLPIRKVDASSVYKNEMACCLCTPMITGIEIVNENCSWVGSRKQHWNGRYRNLVAEKWKQSNWYKTGWWKNNDDQAVIWKRLRLSSSPDLPTKSKIVSMTICKWSWWKGCSAHHGWSIKGINGKEITVPKNLRAQLGLLRPTSGDLWGWDGSIMWRKHQRTIGSRSEWWCRRIKVNQIMATRYRDVY